MSTKKNKTDLKGHVAVITGASSGIGEQYARQLAARGVDLVIAARRLDRLEKLAKELSSAHDVNVQAIEADLAKTGIAQSLFKAATQSSRQVTILVNNAGIGPFGRFVKGPLERHLETLTLNMHALTELSHRFCGHMLEHGKKSFITNIGSIASYQGASNFAVYAATKSYVRIFSEILGRELRETGISVTCVCPGGTYTEFMEANGQVLSDSSHSMMMTACTRTCL